MSEQTASQPTTPAAEPKVRKYLIFWWANNGAISVSGATTVTLTGGGLTQAILPEVRDCVRKETGQSSANVMAFSEFQE